MAKRSLQQIARDLNKHTMAERLDFLQRLSNQILAELERSRTGVAAKPPHWPPQMEFKNH